VLFLFLCFIETWRRYSLYLALVRDAGVETVMQPVALEVDLVGHPIVEGVISEVIAV